MLRSPAGRQRRDELAEAFAETTRRRLLAHADRAIDSWLRQLELADEGRRSNHQPAWDLLTHAGVLDIPTPNKHPEPQLLIQIGTVTDADMKIIEIEGDESTALPPTRTPHAPGRPPGEVSPQAAADTSRASVVSVQAGPRSPQARVSPTGRCCVGFSRHMS